MFLETRKRGSKTKFYLVHSFREGENVVKIRRYLGQDISQAELSKRSKIAERNILGQIAQYRQVRDPMQTALSGTEVDQLKSIQSKVPFKILHLDDRGWKRFSEVFAYNTNAIEGSTLTLRDVKSIAERNKIPDKDISDVREAKGVIEAVRYIRRTKEHISLRLMKKLHIIVFHQTKTFGGSFREKGVEVVIKDAAGNIVHRGAPAEEIEKLLTDLVGWYNKNRKKYPPILLAAVVHNQFENIHPFQDGNGRVGRLLLNNILLKHGLPPVSIEFKRRKEYYISLQKYEDEGDIRPTLELIVKEYRELRKLKMSLQGDKGDHKKK